MAYMATADLWAGRVVNSAKHGKLVKPLLLGRKVNSVCCQSISAISLSTIVVVGALLAWCENRLYTAVLARYHCAGGNIAAWWRSRLHRKHQIQTQGVTGQGNHCSMRAFKHRFVVYFMVGLSLVET